jgi:hypothetical protein
LAPLNSTISTNSTSAVKVSSRTEALSASKCLSNSKNCGSIDFILKNTKETVIQVGELNAGDYTINFFCFSPLPSSTNFVTFSTPENIKIKPLITEEKTKIEIKEDKNTIDCALAENRKFVICFSERLRIGLFFLALITFLLFDF